MDRVRALRGQHEPKPLTCDPGKLVGLWEKLIRSHWENNYGYHIDYGAAAARYIDAFMQNVKWEEVNRRAEVALKCKDPVS